MIPTSALLIVSVVGGLVGLAAISFGAARISSFSKTASMNNAAASAFLLNHEGKIRELHQMRAELHALMAIHWQRRPENYYDRVRSLEFQIRALATPILGAIAQSKLDPASIPEGLFQELMGQSSISRPRPPQRNPR